MASVAASSTDGAPGEHAAWHAGMPIYLLNLPRCTVRLRSATRLLGDLGFPVKEIHVVEALDGQLLWAREGSAVANKGIVRECIWPADPAVDPDWSLCPGLQPRKVRLASSRSDLEAFTVMACQLGHAQIVERFLKTSKPYCFIFEDDLALNSGGRSAEGEPSELPEALARLQAGISYCCGEHGLSEDSVLEMLYMWGTPWSCGKFKNSHTVVNKEIGLQPGHNTYQTHAMLLSRKVAVLVATALADGFAADAAYAKISRARFETQAGVRWWLLKPSLLRQDRRRFGSDVRPPSPEPPDDDDDADDNDTALLEVAKPTRRVKGKQALSPVAVAPVTAPEVPNQSPTRRRWRNWCFDEGRIHCAKVLAEATQAHCAQESEAARDLAREAAATLQEHAQVCETAADNADAIQALQQAYHESQMELAAARASATELRQQLTNEEQTSKRLGDILRRRILD